MNQYKGIEFFWEIIDKKPGENFKIIKSQEEFKILENNKIIEFDKDRWLTHKDNLLHFLNVEKKILLSPNHYNIHIYDTRFGELIGKEIAYNLIEKKIFDICSQQIHDIDKRNKLDDIIDELKNGVYGNTNESDFWFIEKYPYIVSNTFFLRDLTALELLKNRTTEYDNNYGGRCLSLLSIKKILIENISIYESTIDFEMKRLGIKSLETIMKKNDIPRNECLSKKIKRFKTIFEW